MHYKIPRFAIREVSEMTGIKPVTLRAWQRRYGLVQPIPK
jgi:DNA-binding transcriptional MerR regulator